MKTVARPATGLLGQLRPRNQRIHRRVVLDRPLNGQVGTALAYQAGGLGHLVDVGAVARIAGGVGEHRYAWL